MKVRIAVKKLVEFILRSGNIDSRFTGTDRAMQGSQIHRMIQKRQGEEYSSEKTLSIEICEGDILYNIYGRADGIIRKNDDVVIDEIKTVVTPLHLIDENYSPAHWGQGMCYRYIISQQENLEEVGVRLTYYNVDTDEIKYLNKTFSALQLKEFVFDLLKKYRKWAILSDSLKEEREVYLKDLQFPFDSWRDGQRPLSVAVYKTIRDKDRLFACAPTGIGKTMSVVFPALKAMGEGYIDKVFYLTAKAVTRQAAVNAINILYDKNINFGLKMLSITAKDKMCMLPERKCDPVSCPYTRGYFDKVNDIVYDQITNNNVFDMDKILKIAKEHNVCPYELSLDLSEWRDILICDYNYLFDPKVKLQRFFERQKNNYAFLIDEAHNLPDRARDMYSSSLTKKSFFEIKKKLDKADKRLDRSLNEINKVFISFRHMLEEENENRISLKETPSQIIKPVADFIQICGEYFDRHKREPMDEELQSLYFDSITFLQTFDEYNEKYVTLISKYKDDIVIKLFCVDPSDRINRRLNTGRSAVMFSATLRPLKYYIDILGATGQAVSVPSPFDQENLGLFIADRISTRYVHREESVEKVCRLINSFYNSKKGNYIVYFPSYAYMRQTARTFSRLYPDISFLIQEREMDEKAREAFINNFDNSSDDTLLAFCVMGGIYGEGIDLTGDKLIGCAIVGVGLPQINFRSDVLRDYYNSIGQNGYAFAYRYPGMNKVMQAAGRVIRTESDKGVVLLIDDRFTDREYLENMPPHWSHYKIVDNRTRLEEELKKFWGE